MAVIYILQCKREPLNIPITPDLQIRSFEPYFNIRIILLQ
jgi:hypothetical protein